jgi:hypothetical protein
VATAEERHQHLVDDVVLSDDDLAQLPQDLGPAARHLLGEIDRIPFNRLFHVPASSLNA